MDDDSKKISYKNVEGLEEYIAKSVPRPGFSGGITRTIVNQLLAEDRASRTNITESNAVSITRNPIFSGEEYQRVFLLGDSITMRQFRSLSAASISVSGTDVTITISSGGIPVGSYLRVINQANAAANIDVPVVATTSSNCTVRYPFDVTSIVTGTLSGSFYGQANDAGWWNYAAGLLNAQGKPVEVVRNCGDGGDTLVQIKNRIATELAPLVTENDIIVYMGGVNGAGTGSDTSIDESTLSDCVEQTKLILDELLATGAYVHVSTVTQAQSSAYWTTSPSTAIANTEAVNGYIRGRALSEARLKCFDSYAALGGGDYASAGAIETDGIHPLVAGAQLIGARYVTDCGTDYRKGTFKRWLGDIDNYVDADSWNLLTNVQFAGATGATRPTGWDQVTAGGATKTFTLTERTDNLGNDLEIQLDHTSATTYAMGQTITSRVSAGDRLVFGTEMEGGDGAQTHYARCRLDIVVGGETSSYRLQQNHNSYANGGRGLTVGSRYFFENHGGDNDGITGIEIPSGFTSVQFIYEVSLGASGTANVIVSRPHVYKI